MAFKLEDHNKLKEKGYGHTKNKSCKKWVSLVQDKKR
jgi:hypothetical protein